MATISPAANPAGQVTPLSHELEDNALAMETPAFFSKISHATQIYGLKSLMDPVAWIGDWKEYFYPPDGEGPNIIKTYETRVYHPVRIFFPQNYDQTSPQTLPTLFTIHGGGFCIGHSRDNDEWNRHFADSQGVLVIALSYSLAPWAPFPAALRDLEAVILAVLADESLPIDRTPRPGDRAAGATPPPQGRTAILGFSAGGNLALAVSQLSTLRNHPLRPAAVCSVYGCLDFSVPPAEKLANRPYKPDLPPPRGNPSDYLAGAAPSFNWSYIPYGQNLRDPLLSPAFARRDDLPPYVALVAAELDMLSHESWRLACRLSREGADADGRGYAGGAGRRTVPDRKSEDVRWRVCGRDEASGRKGALEGVGTLGAGDERFAFEDRWAGGGVKWLLVPDVIHGFDDSYVRRNVLGGEEALKDADMKTRAYVAEVGRWLKKTVWGL